MEMRIAVDRLSALAHETRLAVFRRLVEGGTSGIPAGELATALAIPPPTLSFHLAQLAHAGLVRARREGRSIRYAPDYDAMLALVGFLFENCCGSGACAPRPSRAPRRAVRSKQ
jgi:ArsR family transcriptional regulator, arsenate/arsenite/antimonite-responsive transcriptional repressor